MAVMNDAEIFQIGYICVEKYVQPFRILYNLAYIAHPNTRVKIIRKGKNCIFFLGNSNSPALKLNFPDDSSKKTISNATILIPAEIFIDMARKKKSMHNQ
jgi:hypothetical protein